MKVKMKIFYVLFIYLFFINESYAESKISKVAVIPFKINSSQDMSYLKDGIWDMLTSRLSGNDILLISKEDVEKVISTNISLNEASAKSIGAKIQADYVLFGSVTVLGENISIDAKIIDATGKKQAIIFFEQSQNINDVIPKINKISEDINEKVFSKKGLAQKAILEKQKEDPSIYANPERLLSEKKQKDPKSSIIVNTETDSAPFKIIKTLDTEIIGLAMGDLDNDSKCEMVFISKNDIDIYKFEANQLVKMKKIKGKKNQRFLSVDIADVKKDGKEQIFITSVNPDSYMLNSFVLQWNGNDFDYIAQNQDWYYRTIEHTSKGRILLCQKKGISDFFTGKIYEVIWNKNAYVPNESMPAPKDANVFGFALANLANTNEEMAVTIDVNDYLRVYKQSGELVWKSEDYYGGSEKFIEVERIKDAEERLFLAQRVIPCNLSKDGKSQIFVVKNDSPAGRFLDRFRQFSGGAFVLLSWNGISFSQNWQTQKISGYISDYQILDIDNDGNKEIITSLVTKRESIIQKAKSSILIFKISK